MVTSQRTYVYILCTETQKMNVGSIIINDLIDTSEHITVESQYTNKYSYSSAIY